VALAEAAMATVVGFLILSVIPGFYFTSIKLWQRGTGRLGAVAQADLALHRMEDDIRSARTAVISSDGSSLQLVLPMRSYDASLGREVIALNDSGSLTDGDQVNYYFLQDPHGTGTTGGGVYRRVVHQDGSDEPPKLIADHIFPNLNPRGTGTSDPAPVFFLDGAQRTVTVTVTTAQPTPSASSFAAGDEEPVCRRCGSQLVRVPTSEHLEGEIQCPECGTDVEPTAELVSYQTELLVRNH
jgi:predicted RNA-binding Zn-ribbon protein involved in translation (DUF1610 family)